MNTLLSVLDASGDIEIRWDHDNPAEVENARRMVLDLKAQGYTFFLVDGTPADELAAGRGALNCRRVEADALLPIVPETEAQLGPEPLENARPVFAPVEPKRRGRRSKASGPAATAEVNAVAVRPMRGG